MEVRRDSNFTRLAVRITMKTNIVWMSGDYKWSRAYLMSFIPYSAKGMKSAFIWAIRTPYIATLWIVQWLSMV